MKYETVEIYVKCGGKGCGKPLVRHVSSRFVRKDGTYSQPSLCKECRKLKQSIYRGATADQIRAKVTMEDMGCRVLSAAEIAEIGDRYNVTLKAKREPVKTPDHR